MITVACVAATWAQELDLLSPELVERLRAELEQEGELRLRFVVSSSAG